MGHTYVTHVCVVGGLTSRKYLLVSSPEGLWTDSLNPTDFAGALSDPQSQTACFIIAAFGTPRWQCHEALVDAL